MLGRKFALVICVSIFVLMSQEAQAQDSAVGKSARELLAAKYSPFKFEPIRYQAMFTGPDGQGYFALVMLTFRAFNARPIHKWAVLVTDLEYKPLVVHHHTGSLWLDGFELVTKEGVTHLKLKRYYLKGGEAVWTFSISPSAVELVGDSGLESFWDKAIKESKSGELFLLANENRHDYALAKLKDLPDLRSLDLNGWRIGEKGMEHLAKLSSLESLHLVAAHVDAKGWHEIEKLSSLQLLDLELSNADDQVVEHLAKLTNLKKLDIYGASISREGYAKLKAALPKCEIKR